jgi:hypothetical protein
MIKIARNTYDRGTEMYRVETIRDEIRMHSDLPRPIRDILVEYSVTTGDLLCYARKVYPRSTEHDIPFAYFPISHHIGVWVRDHTMEVTIYGKKYELSLHGEEDPFGNIMKKADMTSYGKCMLSMREHVDFVVWVCMIHLLSASASA